MTTPNYQHLKKMKKDKYSYYKITPGIFPDIIKICFSNEQFQDILKNYEIKDKTVALQMGVAETHYIHNGYLGIIIGVFNLDEMGEEVAQVSGTIAHEASHIVDRMAEYISQDHITDEVRAYFTQFLVEHIWLCVIEERKQNARKQNRELSRKTSKEKRRDEPKVDKHDNGGPGSNSVPKQADAPSGAKVEHWKNIAKTEDSIPTTSGAGVPGDANKLP